MPGNHHDDAEKIKALEQQLHTQKRAWRQKRRQRLKADGRIVELPAPRHPSRNLILLAQIRLPRHPLMNSPPQTRVYQFGG